MPHGTKRVIETWPSSIAEARALQERLRSHVVIGKRVETFYQVAGVDIHVAPATGLTWAAIAVVELKTLELVRSALAAVPTGFPYVPGYLSFREIPAALAALALLEHPPDLLMVDGHGIAHPRRLGIAAHLGVLTDLPAIGVAKSRLIGRHDEPGPGRGSRVALTNRGETLGTVLRSRERARPLYVSVGHLVSLEQAVELVEATLTGYRLPEPTRLADRLSRMHP
jgi:deoxyribonuclease V